jgi:choline monooxygenase
LTDTAVDAARAEARNSRAAYRGLVMLITAPSALYRDPAVFERERRGVFGKAWRFLGLEGDLVEPGDYLSDDLAGFPIVVVRGKDGVLNGFHNVCRHRAGPLVTEEKGRCQGELVCRYHGWRYMLDGRLRSAVGFGAAEGFDPRAFGLHPIRVESWRGLVFVNLDRDAAPLLDTFAPLDELFETRQVRAGSASLKRSHELACNWKTYVENYLEGYHIQAVHPELAAGIDPDRYRVTMRGAVAVHEVPADDGVSEGLWAWVWPNLAFNIYRGSMMVEHMRPAGHGRTRLDYLYLYDPDETDLDAVLAASDRLTGEDRDICEQVQRNLDAGIYDTGVLSPRHENAVAWFQARVAEAIAA